MLTKVVFLVAVGVAFYVAWSEGQTAYSNALEGKVVSPGDIVINEVSTAGEDWITLHNNLDNAVDLNGFIFTDGDNRFVFPKYSTIQPGGEIRLASSKDGGKANEKVDHYWGDWGLSQDGELVMLINNEGDMVLDFVFAPALQKGEKLERHPSGIGAMLGPNSEQLMQLQRPSYRAVPIQSIEDIGRNFSTSVVSVGGLLTAVSTFLINFDQTKEIFEKFIKKPRKKSENKE